MPQYNTLTHRLAGCETTPNVSVWDATGVQCAADRPHLVVGIGGTLLRPGDERGGM